MYDRSKETRKAVQTALPSDVLLCAIVSIGNAQRITHDFQDVTLSDALKYIQEQTTNYDITFIYDELEDFRVTTQIQKKSIPDAIAQIVGFYPVRVVKSGKQEIYVECTHKTDRHLTGTIIDEQGQPVAYANVAILNPADSTLLGGGVSNESGYFAVPYEQERVLARISYVGYKTIYKLCNQPEAGTIRMHPDNYTLKGVTIKGYKPTMKMISGGMEIDVQNTLLAEAGFFNGALAFNLTINDIFNTNMEKWKMRTHDVEIIKDCNNYSMTRGIRLQVTYNFNTTRSKYKGTGAGNDEKNRL